MRVVYFDRRNPPIPREKFREAINEACKGKPIEYLLYLSNGKKALCTGENLRAMIQGTRPRPDTMGLGQAIDNYGGSSLSDVYDRAKRMLSRHERKKGRACQKKLKSRLM